MNKFAPFDGAILRATSIVDTAFPGEWTGDQFLKMIDFWGATVCNLTGKDGVALFSGRCLLRRAPLGPYYQLVEERMSWREARGLAEGRSLRRPVFADERDRPETRCFNGALWTVKSAEEQSFVLKVFDPAEASAVWLAASDEKQEGVWRWIGGSDDGRVLWSGGPNGYGGAPPPGWFASSRRGEPNNNTITEKMLQERPELRQLEEHWAATGRTGEWNDVTLQSRLLPLIKYEPAGCREG